MVNSKPTIKQASDARLKRAEATLERAREAERVRRGVERPLLRRMRAWRPNGSDARRVSSGPQR
jgi:hypothetical protein